MIEEIGSERIATRWNLHWFQVDNPALPIEEQTQGVWITARTRTRRIQKAVLITQAGTQQSIQVTLPLLVAEEAAASSPDVKDSRELLEKILGSMRISDDLLIGRAWIDRELENTQSGALTLVTSPEERLKKILELQVPLFSKISTDPSAIEAYYHLGGLTQLALTAVGEHQAHPSNTELSSALAAVTPGRLSGLLQTASKLARDVSPDHPRTRELARLWQLYEEKNPHGKKPTYQPVVFTKP
jgi:hypothetical protein